MRMAGNSTVKIAYGLDLAGYSTGKSALARVERECDSEKVCAKIFDDHPFAKRRIRREELNVECEGKAIEFMFGKGRLSVDVPIDLQGLMGLDPPDPEAGTDPHRFTWELTLRPVDYAFDALPPLATFIGSPVARFRNTLKTFGTSPLGQRLWETYPAAVLRLLGDSSACGSMIERRSYKGGRAKREGGNWVPLPKGKKQMAAARAEALACKATELGITASDETTIDDDDLDATLCALTGVAPPFALLCGSALEIEISCRIAKKLNSTSRKARAERPGQETRATAPLGYVLLRCKFWSQIHLEREKWNAQEKSR